MYTCNMGIDCDECPGCHNLDYEENTNVKFGFDDMTEWEKENPGENEYSCECCGLYKASKPRCNKSSQSARGSQCRSMHS